MQVGSKRVALMGKHNIIGLASALAAAMTTGQRNQVVANAPESVGVSLKTAAYRTHRRDHQVPNKTSRGKRRRATRRR